MRSRRRSRHVRSSPRHAILMATAFNFIGAFAGTAVAKTIGAGLVDEATTTQAVVAAALLGAITWNLITWWFGLPSLELACAHRWPARRHDHRGRGGCARRRRAGQQGPDPDGLVPVPRLRHRVPADAVPLLDLPEREAQADGPRLPSAAGCLGGLHGVQPRLERRAEDDGHHHALRCSPPASSRPSTSRSG